MNRPSRVASGEHPVSTPRDPVTAKDPHPADVVTLLADAGSLPSPASGAHRPIRAIDLARGLATDSTFSTRYDALGLLGEGGMGAVVLCRDQSIGRDVAVKVLREDASTEATERFVHEARTQGQLEHPSIVPVHEVGTTADGRPYFTMRRVRGRNLAEILEALRRGDPDAVQRYSRRKLLTAFASVCLTIDYAHSRGIVHRDLKPSNVMLGEFGEVQLLDWGLAKLVGEPDLPASVAALAVTAKSADAGPWDSGPKTEIGAVLGTPGYMAPEQLEGDPSLISSKTDIHSLGAILFELLTLHPLHGGGSLLEVVEATRRGIEARPSKRHPECDVPPELEQVIVHATARDPLRRYASAREMADAIERYLDGDRDLARRQELAREHLARARASGTPRAEAMAEVSRAVALDPENDEALGLLARLLVEVPDELPPEAERELEQRAARARSDAARIGLGAFTLRLLFFPLVAFMGVRAWGLAGFILALLAGSVVLAFWLWRRRTMELWQGALLLVVSTLSIALIGSIFGSYLLVPPLILMNNVTFALHAGPKLRRVVMLFGALAILVPLGLELGGVLPPAYAFDGEHLLVLPRLVGFPPAITLTVLTLSTVALVSLPVVFFGRARDALALAERRLFLQAWHLRNLVPERVRKSLGGGE